jgi:hypothetical protein
VDVTPEAVRRLTVELYVVVLPQAEDARRALYSSDAELELRHSLAGHRGSHDRLSALPSCCSTQLAAELPACLTGMLDATYGPTSRGTHVCAGLSHWSPLEPHRLLLLVPPISTWVIRPEALRTREWLKDRSSDPH